MPINLEQPQDNVFEISLFGPGTGECIVAHIGDGKWMIVDSCCLKGTKQPVALEYLKSLGVPFESVALIVVSHFHDDHIQGITEIVKSCSNAVICISSALVKEESIAFVQAYSMPDVLDDANRPSTHELKKLIEIMDPNKRNFKFASESMVVYRKDSIVIHALSPSHNAHAQSLLDFAREYKDTTRTFRKIAKKLTPNLCAVALHICNGVDTILLGSDLETSNSIGLGWEAVVASTTRPRKKASVFKVPHHGSVTGHLDSVVLGMLDSGPISIMTTMNTHHLPGPDDLARIKAYSSSVHLTTQPLIKPPKRDRAVDEIIAKVTKKRRVCSKVMGHVQLRINNGVVSIEYNEHASAA